MLDAGAEEVNDRGAGFEIITDPADLVRARTALQDARIDYDSADIEFVPGVLVEVDVDHARKLFRLIDAGRQRRRAEHLRQFDVPADVLAILDEE